MQIDGDRLNIPADLKVQEITALKEFVLPRLEFIEEVGFEGPVVLPESSSLIAFLLSLKKTKPSIKIALLDSGSCDFGKYSTAHWITHEQ